jgi:molybdate transport system substrate-binding protein
LVLLLSGCGRTIGGDHHITVTVAVDVSLAAAIDAAGQAYARAHPGVQVRTVPATRPDLMSRVRSKDPVDVVVTSDATLLSDLGQTLVGKRVLGVDVLTIVVPRGNPAGVHSLVDLGRPGMMVALTIATEPSGRDARKALAAAGVDVVPTSDEPDARAVVTQVREGAAAAGLVHASDAAAGGPAVELVPIPEARGLAATCFAKSVAASPRRDVAGDLVLWLRSSDRARSVLRSHGLQVPE